HLGARAAGRGGRGGPRDAHRGHRPDADALPGYAAQEPGSPGALAMTDKTATNGEGERLLGELRLLAADVDPIPGEVTLFANAALDWRRMDAALAELLSDSLLEQETACARSGIAKARAVTFRASDGDVDLEIRDADPGLALLGQLDPPAKAEVQVQRDDSSIIASAEADELGRFRVELPAGGRVRLLVQREAAPP